MADADQNVSIATTNAIGGTDVKSMPESILREADYGARAASEEQIAAHVQGRRDEAEQRAFDEHYSLAEHPLNFIGSGYGGGLAAYYRGLSGGLSDLAIGKIGDALGVDARGTLRDWERAHPFVSKAEQLSGFTGGMLAGGAGIGAVGRGVLGASRLAEAGSLAASIGLGEGTIARTALGTLARGAVEGGIYSGGEELSRQALSRDPDLHAERILSEMGHGALFGGPAALGLHGLSSLASSGLRSLEESIAKRAAEEATSDGVRVSGEDGMQSLRDLARRGAGKGELIEHAEKLNTELSERYLTKLRALDEAGSQGPSIADFQARVEKAFEPVKGAEPAEGSFGVAEKGSDSEAVHKWTEDLHKRFVDRSESALQESVPRYKDISFADWEEAARDLSKTVKDNPEAANKLRNIMLDTSDAALEGSTAGKSVVEEAQSARDLYKSIHDAKHLLSIGSEDEIAAKIGKQGLADQALDMAKSKIGKYATDVAIHTVLSPLGPVGSMVAPLAKRLVGKIAESASLEGVSSAVRQHIQSAAGALAKGGKLAARTASIEPLGISLSSDTLSSAMKIRERATQLAAAPDRQMHFATEAAASLRAPTPIASSMGGVVSRMVTELANRAPKEGKGAGLFSAPKGMSDTEAAKYVSVAKSIAEPRSLLSDARAGTLTKDQVDAVKSVWPRLYEEMAGELTKAIVGNDKAPSYQDRIAISTLLGTDADPTMSGSFILATQPQPKGGGGGGEGKTTRSPKPIKLASLAIAGSGADSAVVRAQTGGKNK
jgi:hypothetical protein